MRLEDVARYLVDIKERRRRLAMGDTDEIFDLLFKAREMFTDAEAVEETTVLPNTTFNDFTTILSDLMFMVEGYLPSGGVNNETEE